jgi:hypothetical protein
MVRYVDIHANEQQIRDLTSLTIEQFTALVNPFETAFVQYMDAWRFFRRCRERPYI